MDIKGKIILVTGSSKGLGRIVAEKLLAKGAHVIGWSRSSSRILHSKYTEYLVDIGDEAAVNATFAKVLKEHPTIDGLINNAGFGAYAPIEAMDHAVTKAMFDTNVLGLIHLTQLAVPVMKKAQSGHIINVSSVAGIIGIENMSVYNATKFAVKGFSESLYKELRNDGIKVTCILPGSIETSFFDQLENFTKSNNTMDANDVAETLLFCLESSTTFHPVNLELKPMPTK